MPWTVRTISPDVVTNLSVTLGISPVTARCLAARGVDCAVSGRAYLEPRLAALRVPRGLAGLEEAVDRIVKAAMTGQRIGIFGDYDVDGVTTAALMTSYLRGAGIECVARVARRDAGYGFGVEDAAQLHAAGCELIITGDCGTSDLAAIEHARALGIEVVVVDHHTVPATDGAPHPALALINPFRHDSTFPFRGMASVGLAFYVMAAVRTRLVAQGYFANRPQPELRDLLDLVALGTICDLVPLQGENRILTALGLRLMQSRQRPGLAALLHTAGVDLERPIDERTVAWKLGPRLNAPGRLGDAEPALALLLADEHDAMACAARLEEANAQRRLEQDRALEEASALLGDADPGPAVVVAGRGWASGVVGIVAAKLVDRYQRPAFVIAVDPITGEGRGSARSIDGIDLYEVLGASAPQLQRFGGHAAAAGFSVASAHLEPLRDAIHSAVERQRQTIEVRPHEVDAEVELGEIDAQLARELASLAPFGKGNPDPLLACRELTVRSSRRVGDGSHLKLEVADRSGRSVAAIGFGLGPQDPGVGASIHATFAPTENLWRGRRTLELELRTVHRI